MLGYFDLVNPVTASSCTGGQIGVVVSTNHYSFDNTYKGHILQFRNLDTVDLSHTGIVLSNTELVDKGIYVALLKPVGT